MNRVCSLALFLASLPALAAEEPKTPRTDLYGDPLPPGAIARLGTIRLRHRCPAVTFSKDGKRLISFGHEGEVRIWEAASGKLLRRRQLAPTPARRDAEYLSFMLGITNLSLSSSGATAAIQHGSGCSVFLFDTTTAKKRGEFANGREFALSSDDAVLAVATDAGVERSSLELWELTEGKNRLSRKLALPYRLSELALAPDGKRVAEIQVPADARQKRESAVHLWDATTGKEIGKDDKGKTSGLSLAFSPDGKTLAVGRVKGAVRLLSVATFTEKTVLLPPRGVEVDCIHRLAFSPDGRLLAGNYSNSSEQAVKAGVFLWNLSEPKQVRQLPNEGYDNQSAFSPDGKLLACFDPSTSEIRLWDLESGRRVNRRPSPTTACARPLPYAELANAPDGKIVASCTVDGRHLWNTAGGELLPGPWNDALSSPPCLFSPDSKHFVAANTKGLLQMWDVVGGKEVQSFALPRTLRKGGSKFLAANISPDGKRLSAIHYAEPAQLFVWDVETGKQLSQRPYKLVRRVSEHFALPPVPSRGQAAFAPDGETISIVLDEGDRPGEYGSGLRMGLEEVSTGRLRARLPKDVGLPVVFSPQGRLLAAPIFRPDAAPVGGNNVKGLCLVEAASGEEVLRLDIERITCFAFAPDGRSVVTTDSDALRVWDADTGERLYQRKWLDADSTVCSLVVLPGGRAATGTSEGDILVWDLAPSTWPIRKPRDELGGRELSALWSDLAGDARKASRAISTLAAAPAQALPLLSAHLRPATRIEAKRMEQLLADLDNDSFETREAATRELTRLCYRIEPTLRGTLESKPSLEMRRRLESILSAPNRLPAEALRTLRAIAVLERIGTPEARRILEKIAGGADAPETREAQTALQRLKRRGASANGRSLP